MDGSNIGSSSAAAAANNASNNSLPATPKQLFTRSRTAKACDSCKARKVKCDGLQPCSYCVRRQRTHECRYSPHRRRNHGLSTASAAAVLPRSPPQSASSGARSSGDLSLGHGRPWTASATTTTTTTTTATNVTDNHSATEDDTEVPREARLLRDAQGKLIFIGDCAPLSFFQSVRQLVTSRVGQNAAFAPETSRFSVLLENAPLGQQHQQQSQEAFAPSDRGLPDVEVAHVAPAVSVFRTVTSGLVDLFDEVALEEDMLRWAELDQRPRSLNSILFHLVLAIGRRHEDEAAARAYFEYARDQAYLSLSSNLSVGTIQAFVLITVYMLLSCQINTAFLVFGIAVRAAYSIGLHRTEVNARFSPEIHRQRDRLWKSVRVVDLFLSVSMGRPPATSDVDCTVPYRTLDNEGNEAFDLLNASVQILLLLEVLVTQIYSQKKISLQLTEGISLQLREWSARWLRRLKHVVAQPSEYSEAEVSGACQILASYYYAVMLVSRPFLMYELFRRLSESSGSSQRASALASGKSRLADACIDAASLMVDSLHPLIEERTLNGQMPLLVSWLFASSLVLGVGLLGGFGRILEKYTRMSIKALDYFSLYNTHATQYSLIAQSLLTTALEYLEKRELQERLRRTESSSQLFGLIPLETRQRMAASPVRYRDSQGTTESPASSVSRRQESLEESFYNSHGAQAGHSPQLGDIDAAFLSLNEPLMANHEANFWNTYQGYTNDPGSALNLFPLLDSGGGIDLAHYL